MAAWDSGTDFTTESTEEKLEATEKYFFCHEEHEET